MADHRYKPGQVVSLTRSFMDRGPSGAFEIVRLLPAAVDGEPRYRVRGSDNTERAVGEGQVILRG